MAFEDTEDRSIFVSDFGKDVEVRGSITGFRTIRAIFDNEYAGLTGESVEYATLSPRLTCLSEDVRGIKYGDDITVDSTFYKVVTVMPNGTGITEIMLEAQ